MNRVVVDFDKYDRVRMQSLIRKKGKVVNVVGLTIESAGPDAKLGDVCRILTGNDANAKPVMAEVVGFKDRKTLLMPYSSVAGIGLGSIVENTEKTLKVMVSDELLGKALDGLGHPVNGDDVPDGVPYPVEAPPPDPMTRKIIDEVLPLGVKAVDCRLR